MSRVNDWAGAGVALARVLGAVHAAVAVSLVDPGRVSLAGAGLAGVAVYWAGGRFLAGRPATEAAAWAYLAPLALAAAARVAVVTPPDWPAAQAEAVAFVARVWAQTPVPAYLAAAGVSLLRLRVEPPKDPLAP